MSPAIHPLCSSLCCSRNICCVLRLVLQLCWHRQSHSDGCGNEPSLASNLLHISWANTGRLLAATLLQSPNKLHRRPLAASHKAMDPQMLHLYLLLEKKLCPVSARSHKCLSPGFPNVHGWNNKREIPRHSYRRPHGVVSPSSSVFPGLWPAQSLIFPLLQAPIAPAT